MSAEGEEPGPVGGLAPRMDERAVGLDAGEDRVGARRPGLGSPSLVRAAFGTSIALHLLAIAMYPALVRRLGPEAVGVGLPAVFGSPDGVQVLRIVEIDVVGDVERPEDPEEIEDFEVGSVNAAGPRLEDEGGVELARPGLTPAEILRPRPTDRRLWAPLPPEFRELTLEQREELMIAGRLNAWYDSVAAVAAAEAAWKDWTFTDGSGGRWGVSEGQLHLGDVTIPLPFSFQPPPEQREYMWQWNEIARQGAQAAVQQSVRERMEAIRARRDREREAARADSAAASSR